MTPAEKSEFDFWRQWLTSEGKVSGFAGCHEEFLRRRDGGPLSEPMIEEKISPGTRVRILDVGAGPMSFLGNQHPSAQLEIVATDRLAREYESLLQELNIHPPIMSLPITGEGLLTWFLPFSFDFTYARNSLDHAGDPLTIIDNMARLTVKGGHLILRHHPNEGRNERYHGLHQWNFSLDPRLNPPEDGLTGDCLLSDNQDKTVNVSAWLRNYGWVAALVENDWLIFVMRKIK